MYQRQKRQKRQKREEGAKESQEREKKRTKGREHREEENKKKLGRRREENQDGGGDVQQTESLGSVRPTTFHKRARQLPGEGSASKQGSSSRLKFHQPEEDITLDWLQSIHASFCGDPAVAIQDTEGMEFRLGYFTGHFGVVTVKGIAFFDDMESYLVRSEKGRIYLWVNEADILYDLGRSRKEVAQALQTEGYGWWKIPSIKPRYLKS